MPSLWMPPPIVKQSTICRYVWFLCNCFDANSVLIYNVLLTIDNVQLLLNAGDASEHLWLRHLLLGHPICLLASALCG